MEKAQIKKALLGKYLKCRHCEGQAYISMPDFQYMVNCISCGAKYHLKIHSTTKKNIAVELI
jgi:transcription elongation factor Elf1